MTALPSDARDEYLNRECVMKILSDAEVAKVSAAETEDHLSDGEQYLDLRHLGRGVLRAPAVKTSMGRVLPKRAVHEETWEKILAHLAKHGPTSAARAHDKPAELKDLVAPLRQASSTLWKLTKQAFRPRARASHPSA